VKTGKEIHSLSGHTEEIEVGAACRTVDIDDNLKVPEKSC